MYIAAWKNRKIQRQLRNLFGRGYTELPIVSRSFSALDLPNVRRAVEAFAAEQNASFEVQTVVYHLALTSTDLKNAPPQFLQVDIDVDEHEDCLLNPVYLISGRELTCAVRVSIPAVMEVVAPTREIASRCLEDLRRLMRTCSVYRGRVISIESQHQMDDYASATNPGDKVVRFHRLPPVTSDAIILPSETMRRIQRNTVGFFRNVERLKRHGFSAKRGLLLHGPPGTGKTRTACWLTHSLPGVTVFLVTGEQLWNIKEC